MALEQVQATDHYSVFSRVRTGGLAAAALALAVLLPSYSLAAAAKPAPAKAAPPKAPAFDARRTADVIALLASLEAKAEVARQADGQVFMNVTTPGGGFGAQMVGCDETFATCRANMVQINDYNRSQLTCRGIMTPSGEPSVMYAVLLNGRMTRDELREHVGVWQGCLTGFGEFIQDPVGFLSRPQG